MKTLIDILSGLTGPLPYIVVFVILLVCGLGVPIPEDVTLFAAGVMAYYGKANVYLMIIVSLFGVLVGDSFMYWLGAKYGKAITQKRFFARFLTEETLNNVQHRLLTKGSKLIFAARFMPGFRAAVFFSAGVLHLPYRNFFMLDGAAALISVPAIIYSIYFFGDQLDWIIQTIKRVQGGVLTVIVLSIGFVIFKWYLKRKKNHTTV